LAVVKTKDGKRNLTRAQMPAALIPKHLADALGLLAVSSLKLASAPWSTSMAPFFF